jgi:two-component system NtrC family sensor kinase
LQDITYLKELDRMKGEFVSTVSHDLRSPLASVRGYIDLVGVMGPVTAQQQDALERMRRAVTQMTELINDLLDLGKIEAGIDAQKAPCVVGAIVREVVEAQMGSASKKGVVLQSSIDEGLPQVLGDAAQLRRVAANLVDNAIKYTPAGGKVLVFLGRHGGEVLLSVTDTGIGIAAADQEQLFQKFYRVETPQTEGIPGTGLGLAIVRSIVEQHGGQVAVKSEPGKGSTFRVTLPAGA